MTDSNRSELPVESNALLRRATWCGIVFALAVVLTCLNFMPPIDVHYHVRSKVVVSETRLEQLSQLAIADRQAAKQGKSKRIQLLSVKVLDLADQQASVAAQATAEKVVLVEVGTLWTSRCTAERHFTWLKNISQIDPSKLTNTRTAQAVRFARWELEAAQHYQAQHKFLSEKEQLPPPELPANLAATADRPTFQLASFSQPGASEKADPSAIVSGDANFGLQLSTHLDQAKTHVAAAERAWQSELEQSSGALQIASAPLISPRSTTIPFWMAASVLILGLSAGSSAGWFLLRQQSGGAWRPNAVAEPLTLDNLPIVGRLRLPYVTGSAAPAQDECSPVVRTGRRLTKLSEWAVTFWVVLAIGRFFLDSIWRDVLVDSPLAALGRLMAGMP